MVWGPLPFGRNGNVCSLVPLLSAPRQKRQSRDRQYDAVSQVILLVRMSRRARIPPLCLNGTMIARSGRIYGGNEPHCRYESHFIFVAAFNVIQEQGALSRVI